MTLVLRGEGDGSSAHHLVLSCCYRRRRLPFSAATVNAEHAAAQSGVAEFEVIHERSRLEGSRRSASRLWFG